MTRLVKLRADRAELAARYERARRRHDRTRATGAALESATTALLRAEIRARQARRPAEQASLADLFGLGAVDYAKGS
ncbi:MAG TPA: hypothetical protein PLV92_06270 [Pirellulaceae bacterium]|nr:hypothetical protein [Pirellulaceae bacterium]